MRSFGGFPVGKTRFTPIPDLLFTELLQGIVDPAELKLVLFMFWFLNRQQGYPRYMTLAELEGEGLLLSALTPHAAEGIGRTPIQTLRRAVDQSVERGLVLRLGIAQETEETVYLFLNTPQGRKAVEQVRDGSLILETTGFVREAHIDEERSNIFELYEQNIGLLQPILVEDLAEAQASFPADWIADAFKVAVERNVRNWRYISAILRRWERDGKDDGERDPRQRSRRTRRRLER